MELVFPEEQAVQLLRAAEEQDVAAGGVFSAGPGGIQVWSEPWNGDGGTSGSSVQLGSVEWTANAPTRSYITIHRGRVTRAGKAVPGLLHDLESAGVSLDTIEVARPTLDDVFLTLTGRSRRDADAATEERAAAHEGAHA